MNSTKLKNYYIAYIDILGMKNKMEKYTEQDFNELCNKISKLVKSIISGNQSNEKYGVAHIDFHMFSDNMIFLCEDFSTLIDFIALLQRRIIVQLKLLIKGGINYGSVYYEKGQFLLGKGLLYAYKLDEDYHNPAIRIEKSIAEKYDIGTTIKQLSYDEFIVDYLYHSLGYDRYDFEEYDLPSHKNIIVTGLSSNKNFKVLEKYNWLKEYHNLFCREQNLLGQIID
ncbi:MULTISPECIES: hypothetical protein [Clostridium]|uniref:Guanylate cyclase domain-containing protein n=1 Tax=Clostridium saccharobutylicum TaxID=169679 RepID=A0A1S8N3B0_CLOSA|nr:MULTISPECIES: hypothetical protein [Clostridium]MDR3596452.1 hypothetical protein [Clostridium sp.]OOM11006.1 hypothetical protein CLOSAC_25340 [Clostridium saccharobutylicum]